MRTDLFDQHRAILAAAEALSAALQRSPRMPINDIHGYRMRLGTLIKQHRRAEEEQIFGPLFTDGMIGALPFLEPVIRQIRQDKARYSENVRRWTPKSIEADWRGYGMTVAERVGELRQLIRTEEEMIYRPVQQHILAMARTAAIGKVARGHHSRADASHLPI